MITKEKIKCSLSARWHRHNLITYGIVSLIYAVIMFFIAAFAALEHGDFLLSISITGGIFLVFVIAVSPFVIYEIYSYKKLFKDIDKYELCEARLDKPSMSYWLRGAVYYNLYFQLSDYVNVSKATRAMWSSSPFAPNQFEYYNNKTVEVAYDRESDRLVVIGLKK